MSKRVVVDADGHVLEPEDLWQRFLEPQWRDRALVAFDNLCAAYAQRITWEVPEHTNERAALLLPALLLAGVHGDATFRWLHNPRSSETIAGIARRLLVQPMVRLAAVREAWRRSLPL